MGNILLINSILGKQIKSSLQIKFIETALIYLGLFVIFTYSPLDLFAQTYLFHHLTPEEGLSQASNDYIFHDSKGFVWLSSIDGLNRFDGKSVKVYKSISGDSTSLIGNIITSNFYEDEYTNLWFTTYEGIHCYVREKDHFKHFQINDSAQKSLTQDYHAFHLDEQQTLWVRIGIGESGKLYLFNIQNETNKLLCSLKGQRNFPILDEKNEVKQIVSSNIIEQTGIIISDLQSPFEVQSFFDATHLGQPSLEVNHFTKAKEDAWYLGSEKGLILFNPLTDEYSIYNEYKGIQIGQVLSSASINDSILWVASASLGILIFDKNKKTFIGDIPSANQDKLGLNIETANRIYKDHQENVWVSSFSSGVNYTNLEKRKFEVPEVFINQNIASIYESEKGAVFCGFSKGQIAYYESIDELSRTSPVLLEPVNNKQSVLFFFEFGESDLWAVTINQLLKWNEKLLRFDFVQDLPNYMLYVHKLHDDRVLFATYSGIFEFDINNKKVDVTPFDPLGEYQKELATSIYESDDNKLYVAVDASKVLVLENDNDGYAMTDQIEGIGYAKDYFEDDKSVWIATSNGILKVNKQDNTYALLNEKNDGIPNEYFYSIIPDEEGSFWLSGNNGIVHYFPQDRRYRRYNLIDGIQAYEYNTNSFLKTSSGEIWMGGTKGLNRFHPKTIKDLPNPPKIQITRLLINDEPFGTEKQVGETEELNLAHYNNTLSFDFVALEYSDPKNNQLQYQLENHEEDWVDAEKNGFARYSNLPPGNYAFKIKASNSDGIWNDSIHTIRINIQKPWWQTWWFYTLCLLAVSSIIYGIFWSRLQQALKLERMRVKISSDLHDDVGSILAGLTMQTEILAITANEERQPKLNRVSELSRSAMSRMRDTVWAIDARKDKLKNLLDRVREHASEALELKNISFDLKMTDISLDKKMSSQMRQNLYLICKEAITNTAKHSNGDSMEISFSKHGRNGIELSIFDNGKIDKSKMKTSGLGMSNIQMRAKEIGAKLEIKMDNGFLIRLRIP